MLLFCSVSNVIAIIKMKMHHQLPRVNIGFLPTPLVFLKSLTAHLDGPMIYMKRDDCTGLATGGNKTRKLEFLVAQALERKCDTLLTGGGLQSNHVRQTAAAAAQFGLKCELVLNESPYHDDVFYKQNGNVVLDHILGAKLHIIAKDRNINEEMEHVFNNLKASGAEPYFIPLGGSNEVGATGYMIALEEIYEQCKEHNIRASHLVCALGTGGTQAGLIVGSHLLDWKLKVLGFSVGIKNPEEKIRLNTILQSICHLQNINPTDLVDYYTIDENYLGMGYGQSTSDSINAIKVVAQREGILLDPVYTGKAMAGLIDYIKNGRFKKTDVVIFLHTGGTTALHAYAKEFL
jgi:L-cysteate sulfo-lyase